jgi:hypothetical protein
MGCSGGVQDARFLKSLADRRRPRARCRPTRDRRCCPWSVLHRGSLAHVAATESAQRSAAGGELTSAAAPEELRAEPGHPQVGRRHSRGGHSTAGDDKTAGRRRWTSGGLDGGLVRVECGCGPAIGCREVVAAIGRDNKQVEVRRRVDKRLARTGPRA